MFDTSTMRTYLHDALVLSRGVTHHLALPDGLRKRFFDIDVFASLAGRNHDEDVPVVRCGNDDPVNLLVVQHSTEISDCARLPVLSFLDLGANLFEDFAVDIANGFDFSSILDRVR